jgi:hypothetical protein
MAKGSKKPQLSLDDIVDYATKMMGGKTAPTTNPREAMGRAVNRGTVEYLDPKDFGQPNRLATDAFDLVTPAFSAAETKRLTEQGPDRGHLASLALLAAFSKVPKAYRGLRNAARSATNISKDKGVQPIKPMRQQTADLAGTANDPMTIFALLSALENRR